MRLSIVVPVLNESAELGAALDALAPLRRAGHEVLVVDGGSEDGTPEIARAGADRVLGAPRGRASQMNAGAAAAAGDALVFLHADTRLPPGAERLVAEALASRPWGRFDVRIVGRSRGLGMVAFCMNWRSRLTGIATGDQAIFIRREAFGGFPVQALMEDVAFSAAMRRRARPACLRAKVSTSGRRWDARGLWRTIGLMWFLRAAYFLGASPEALARRYSR